LYLLKLTLTGLHEAGYIPQHAAQQLLGYEAAPNECEVEAAPVADPGNHRINDVLEGRLVM